MTVFPRNITAKEKEMPSEARTSKYKNDRAAVQVASVALAVATRKQKRTDIPAWMLTEVLGLAKGKPMAPDAYGRVVDVLAATKRSECLELLAGLLKPRSDAGLKWAKRDKPPLGMYVPYFETVKGAIIAGRM